MMNKNKQIIFSILIGFILSAISIYAATTLSSSDFSYDNSNSSLMSTDVKSAIDELASRSEYACPEKYNCYKDSPHVGDYIQMTPTLTSYTTDTSKTGNSSSQTINPSELNLWRVIDVSYNKITMISEYVSSTEVTFKGETGYKNYVGYLNELADKYQNTNYTISAYHFGYNSSNNQTQYISNIEYSSSASLTTIPESNGGGDDLYEDSYDLVKKIFGTTLAKNVVTKQTGNYWLASRYYYLDGTDEDYFNLRKDAGGYLWSDNTVLYKSDSSSREFAQSASLRPILVLYSTVKYTPSLGTKDDPFILD